MARIRNIKPDLFDDPGICDLSAEAALVFIGLWTQADRAGRLMDEPKRLKIRLRPMSKCDMDAILNELRDANFIIRYQVGDQRLIQVRSFEKHQRPHKDEKASQLPPISAETGLSRCKPVDFSAKTPETETETETETEMETEVAATAAPADLMAAWNDITQKPIPRCRELTDKRRKHAKARLAKRPLSEWRQIITIVQASKFCRGENDRGWTASFDWLIASDDPAVKALEGTYDDRKGPRAVQVQPHVELGSWRDECDRDHGGACGNQHFHAAKMRSQAVSA